MIILQGPHNGQHTQKRTNMEVYIYLESEIICMLEQRTKEMRWSNKMQNTEMVKESTKCNLHDMNLDRKHE